MDEENQEEAACCPRIPTESFADQRKALILMCCVCREVPVTPYQTECGHIGCALCFAKLEADSRSIPRVKKSEDNLNLKP